MRLRGTALFIEGVERGLAAAITPIVVPTNLSSGSPEDRELSLSASRHSWSSKRPARCGLSACPGTLPHLMDHIAMGVFDVFQIPYSAVEREHEAAIASAARKGEMDPDRATAGAAF
jgi:hypothetical protein